MTAGPNSKKYDTFAGFLVGSAWLGWARLLQDLWQSFFGPIHYGVCLILTFVVIAIVAMALPDK